MQEKAIQLNKKDSDLCITLGTVGTIFSLLALFQHLVIMIPFWLTYLMLLVYCVSIMSFISLIQKKKSAPIFLIFSSVILVLLLLFQLVSTVFSLIVILLTIYSLVVTTFLFVSEIPPKLKSNFHYTKEEKEFWSNKL